MKNSVVLFVLIFFNISFAQNDSIVRSAIIARSLRTEAEIQTDLAIEKTLRKERVAKVIKEKEIPYNYLSEEGTYNELIDVYPDGTPIYYQSFNSRASKLANVNTIQNGGKFNLNLTGKNISIGVFDATPVFKRHKGFRDRIGNIHIMSEVVSDNAPLGERRTFQLAQEHSTHVTGTIMAKGLDPDAKGLAQGVKLYSYNWRDDEANMRILALVGGLTSNHSYGTTIISGKKLLIDQRLIGVYDWKAEGFDRVTYSYKNYLPVIAAGNYHQYANIMNNEGIEYNNLVGIATAKNTLVVGSIEQLGSEVDINNVNIASTSNYGPTKDFRIKPDLVAKGEGLYSTINDYSKTENYVLRTDKYTYLAGTSMATPVVTSIVALFQEWAKDNFNSPLKAASIKGLLIHTAHPLNKVFNKDNNTTKYLGEGPNPVYGWGAVDAEKAMQLLQNMPSAKSFLIETDLESRGAREYVIQNDDEDNEIEATLVWTDHAFIFDYSFIGSETIKHALVNDLDMRLKVKDNLYYPWALNKDLRNPIAKEKDNDVDNVERITRKKLPKGESSIIINHKGDMILGPQEYSLIISSKEPITIKAIINSNESREGFLDSVGEEDVFRIENPDGTGKPKDNGDGNYKKDENNTSSGLDKSPNDFEKMGIIVWPNPVQDILHIDYDEQEIELYELHMYDLNGKLVMSDYNIEEKVIEVNNLIKGRYVIKVLTSKGWIAKHILKK